MKRLTLGLISDMEYCASVRASLAEDLCMMLYCFHKLALVKPPFLYLKHLYRVVWP